MRKTISILATLLLLTACNDAAEAPAFNDGTGGQDPIIPDPTPAPTPAPTPTPPPTAEVKTMRFMASALNPSDANMVYKKRIKPIQLGEIVDDKDCSKNHLDKCIKGRQVLFQFNIEEFNRLYPADLWEITKLNLRASYYSVSEGTSHEMICLLNRKLCSGVEIKKFGGLKIPFLWRNSKFWTNSPQDHVINDLFYKFLQAGTNSQGHSIRTDSTFDLIGLFELTPRTLLTTIRKNNNLHFSVNNDTFVEDPELTISAKRRLISQ